MLTEAGCRMRQERLRALLSDLGLDAAVFHDANEIQYFTGRPSPDFVGDIRTQPEIFFIETTGSTLLISDSTERDALVDERVAYQPHLLYTRNPDLLRQTAALLRDCLAGKRLARIGWREEALPQVIGNAITDAVAPDEWLPIDDQIADMERCKDPDEIECLQDAIACNLAAYDAAQLAIAPRVTELVILQSAQLSATLRAGEQVFHSGDYRSGEFGGPARDVALRPDMLYIIDAWTHHHGYWSDLCRTFAIGEPTPLQCEVYGHLKDILLAVPELLKPEVHGSDIWRWMDGRIREHPHLREVGLTHHAGHGVGLRAHEGPDLNRDRDDVIRPGDVVSVEPGAYTPELRAGIRLENTFLITGSGCELLSEYPLSLERQV